MAHRMTIQISAHNHMSTLVWVPNQAELGLLSSKSHMCVLLWCQHQTNLYTHFSAGLDILARAELMCNCLKVFINTLHPHAPQPCKLFGKDICLLDCYTENKTTPALADLPKILPGV